MKPVWHETSIIYEKSPNPDSIKEKIRIGAIRTKDGVDVSIRYNQHCHDEYKIYSHPALCDIPIKQAKELAEAILRAAES
jgi:hypothetical protein